MSSQSVGKPLVSSVTSLVRRSPNLAGHAVPVALYLLTLACEVPGAVARFFIFGLTLLIVLAVTGHQPSRRRRSSPGRPPFIPSSGRCWRSSTRWAPGGCGGQAAVVASHRSESATPMRTPWPT